MSKIVLKGVISEDFVNYKEPCMTIMFPKCSFKCGKDLCQNAELALADDIEARIDYLVDSYILNPITNAVCFQGLEPFDSIEIFELIEAFREKTLDDIVIYTGYTRDEVTNHGWLYDLKEYKNIVVKYGRYETGDKPHFDNTLGVYLSSDDQYAVRES